MLLQLLDSHDFAGQYDFLYLPIDFTRKANLGYAFVNLVSEDWFDKVAAATAESGAVAAHFLELPGSSCGFLEAVRWFQCMVLPFLKGLEQLSARLQHACTILHARFLSPTMQVCEVSWSGPKQGFKAHVDRYKNSPVMHKPLGVGYLGVFGFLCEDVENVGTSAFKEQLVGLSQSRLIFKSCNHRAGLA